MGTYEVFFTGDVSEGVYLATIGRPGIAVEPPGKISVAHRWTPSGGAAFAPFDAKKGIWIQTFDNADHLSDRAFHLVVMTQS